MCMICFSAMQSERMVNATVTNAFFGSGEMPSTTDPATFQEMGDYLAEGYWLEGGDAVSRWSLEGPISYELDGLDANFTTLAETAFASWTAATGIMFVPETGSGSADILVTDDEEGAFAEQFLGGMIGDLSETTFVQINVSADWYEGEPGDPPAFDSYLYATFLHEIGHALGLGHPGPYNDGLYVGFSETIFDADSWQASVMSYFSQSENPHVEASFAYQLSPMPADLYGIEVLYGDIATISPGDDRYFNGGTGGYFQDMTADWIGGAFAEPVTLTLVDDGGTDMLDFSTDEEGLSLDLSPGSLNDLFGGTGNFLLGHQTVIEEALGGAGDDTLWGNAADNILSGGGGTNTLDGGEGQDSAVFAFDLAEAEIIQLADGFRVSHAMATDFLTNFERFEFSDQAISAAELAEISGGVTLLTDEDEALETALPGITQLVSAEADQGTAEVVAGLLHYTPPPEFNGTVTVTYRYTDAAGLSQTGTIALEVAAVNDAPTAQDDPEIEMEEDGTAVLTGLLGNDTDIENDPLHLSGVSVSNGSATIEEEAILFTPDADFFGMIQLQYEVSDGQGGTANALVPISVTPTPDAPMAEDDAHTLNLDQSLVLDALANDSDPDGEEIHYLSAAAQSGQATVIDGELHYTAPSSGTQDVITYVIADETGTTDTAEIAITLEADTETEDPDEDGSVFGGLALLLLIGLGAAFLTI